MNNDELQNVARNETENEAIEELTPEELLSEVETSTKISINRYRPPWADCGWLETVPQSSTEPVSLESIEQRWGGGNFEVRILNKGKYKKSICFQIAGTPRNKNGILAKNPDLAPPPQAAPMAELLPMFQAMMQMQSQQQQKPAQDMDLVLKLLDSANQQSFAFMQQLLSKKSDSDFDLAALSNSVSQLREISSLFGGDTGTEKQESDDTELFPGFGDSGILQVVSSLLGGGGNGKKAGSVDAHGLLDIIKNMSPEQKEIAGNFLMEENEDIDTEEIEIDDTDEDINGETPDTEK